MSTTSVDSMTSFDPQLAKNDSFCRRRRSINKISRMLGGCPSEITRAYLESTSSSPMASPSVSQVSFSPGETGAPNAVKTARRKSLTLPNITTIQSTLFRSNSSSVLKAHLPIPNSPSHASVSTVNPDDVHMHQLNLDLAEDEEPELWGELRDDAHGTMHSPISPIMFNPPSPLPAPPKSLPGLSTNSLSPISDSLPVSPVDSLLLSSLNVAIHGDSLSPLPPSTTVTTPGSATVVTTPSSPPSRRHSIIGRSRSSSHAHRSSLQIFSPKQASSPLGTAEKELEATTTLPVKANWLEQVTSSLQQGVQDRSESADSHSRSPSVPVQAPEWSGQWNQDDMQQVIKRLRNLK
jgi:hypothetical protein